MYQVKELIAPLNIWCDVSLKKSPSNLSFAAQIGFGEPQKKNNNDEN